MQLPHTNGGPSSRAAARVNGASYCRAAQRARAPHTVAAPPRSEQAARGCERRRRPPPPRQAWCLGAASPPTVAAAPSAIGTRRGTCRDTWQSTARHPTQSQKRDRPDASLGRRPQTTSERWPPRRRRRRRVPTSSGRRTGGRSPSSNRVRSARWRRRSPAHRIRAHRGTCRHGTAHGLSSPSGTSVSRSATRCSPDRTRTAAPPCTDHGRSTAPHRPEAAPCPPPRRRRTSHCSWGQRSREHSSSAPGGSYRVRGSSGTRTGIAGMSTRARASPDRTRSP